MQITLRPLSGSGAAIWPGMNRERRAAEKRAVEDRERTERRLAEQQRRQEQQQARELEWGQRLRVLEGQLAALNGGIATNGTATRSPDDDGGYAESVCGAGRWSVSPKRIGCEATGPGVGRTF